MPSRALPIATGGKSVTAFAPVRWIGQLARGTASVAPRGRFCMNARPGMMTATVRSCQRLLDVPLGQGEPQIPAHRQHDDFGWSQKPVKAEPGCGNGRRRRDGSFTDQSSSTSESNTALAAIRRRHRTPPADLVLTVRLTAFRHASDGPSRPPAPSQTTSAGTAHMVRHRRRNVDDPAGQVTPMLR